MMHLKYKCWVFLNISFVIWFNVASILLKKPELHHYRLQLRKVKLTWNVSKSNAKLAEISHGVSALIGSSLG